MVSETKVPQGGKGWLSRMRSLAVGTFVCWHLFMLLMTNAELDRHVDTWKKLAGESTVGLRAIDLAEASFEAARWYEAMACLDQSWGMFSSPLSRSTPFVAGKIEFADGSSELILSPNEPTDPTHYWRFGQARLRKLESHLLGDLEGTYEYGLLRRFAEEVMKQWRGANPTDNRQPVAVVILRRSYDIPLPGNRWTKHPKVETTEHARFPWPGDSR